MNFNKIKKILKHKVVGIAGAGGLGSNVAVSLCRTGIGKLIIADFDIIEESNLNRQYYFQNQIGQAKVEALKENLLRINSEIIVEIHKVKLDENNLIPIFKSCDIIIEAFDNTSSKKMIIENCIEYLPNIPLISGMGMAGFGNLEKMNTTKYENLYICGDGVSEVSENNPPLAPRVAIVANMQADKTLELLLKKE